MINPPATVRLVEAGDHPQWLRMRRSLWPEIETATHASEMPDWAAQACGVCFVADAGNRQLAGFIEVAVRPCSVDGEIGRFGYIEGWFVEPEHRRQGWGRLLVAHAERWSRAQGCHKLLSDARWDNVHSVAAHQALRFREVERLVHFEKVLEVD